MIINIFFFSENIVSEMYENFQNYFKSGFKQSFEISIGFGREL